MRRIKYGSNDISDPRFRCFGCCHVRTGTMCLGFYHLLIQTVAILALLFAVTHPEVFWGTQEEHKNGNVNGVKKEYEDTSYLPKLPTPQAQKSAQPMDDERFYKIGYTKSEVMMFTKRRLQNGDAHMALALLLGLFFITSMLLHGTAKNRPVYLLPFFCFQVFDLIVSCMTAVGHYTWLPNVQQILVDNPDLPFRDQLMNMNSQWMALCILMAYVTVLFAKAYFIGVVWACYQYLHLRQASVITYTMTEDGRENGDGEMLLPPDYESALKLPQAGNPPPPYGAAAY